MPKNEPQSYGSQSEWLTGKTGETVNQAKGHPTSQHGDFYESRHDSDESKGDQGGKISDEQLAENAQMMDATEPAADQPISRVTTAPGGARRNSEFKKRDYK